MMTDQQFSARMAAIDQEHARRREHADAYRDQEMSRLFEECEWTQEHIAKRVGKRQQWVSLRLIFARFLSFTTTVVGTQSLSQLTERRFRSLHQGTRGTETERFGQVLARLNDSLPLGYRNQVKKPGYRAALIEIMNDRKWYTIEQLLASLQEIFPDADERAVSNGIRNIRALVETKSIGRRCQYRLRRDGKPVATAPVVNLYEKAAPLLDELDEIGRMHECRMSPAVVRMIAVKLRRLFDSVLEEATA